MGDRPGEYTPPAHAAFCRATSQVEREMGELLADEEMWEEEYITIRLCRAVMPEVRYARFNKNQEGRVGADMIWWWVDRSGECFGCLIQAKSIKQEGRHWRIGFHHPKNTGEQMAKLFRAADMFHLPAGFLLYAGDQNYRRRMGCTSQHTDEVPCHERPGAAMTLVPALAADREIQLAAQAPWDRSAVEVFCQWAIPLIDVTAPRPYGRSKLYRGLNLGAVDHGLREFLYTDQIGARKVARHVFDVVGRMALPLFSLAAPARAIDTDPECVFRHLPDLTAHFTVPYFQHMLRGLRRELPDYVERCLFGNVPDEIAQQIDGIMLIQL
ncbi:hypothetical protein [Streptomyces sp. NPDC021622]|uniref:hypothetical protein n=1 Tax=Streptomyces sp. NPDC021622 TaxID=3155013 RepID=UPI00340229E6